MSAMSLLWLLASLVTVVVAHQLLVRATKAIQLSAAPLSGEAMDSVLYERTLLAFTETDIQWTWALLLASAVGLWGYAQGLPEAGWFGLAGLLAWIAAVGWDLYSWERVAASVKFVTWRRGWRHSARRVPISRLSELHVVEKPGLLGLGTCYIALQMDDGKATKLPRTGVPMQLRRVEDVANFVRLQMQQVEEVRRRAANERRREGKPVLDAQERELRKRLRELRQGREENHPAP